jgi:hypothetical protein
VKRRVHHKGGSYEIRVAWQKKPVAFLSPYDGDDFHDLISRYKTVNNFLKGQAEAGFLVSPEVINACKKLVAHGAGDIPYRQWRHWTEDLEKQRKKEKKRIENETPKEPEKSETAADDFLGILGERTSDEPDLGFRAYRLEGADFNEPVNAEKALEKEIEAAKEFEKLLPRKPSKKELWEYWEFALRLKYDKEYRAEFEKKNNLKVVNYE